MATEESEGFPAGWTMQGVFTQRFHIVRISSSQAQVERSIRYCLEKGLPIEEKADESYQVCLVFSGGRESLIQPLKTLRANIVLCATYAQGVARFSALYRNESTKELWEAGKYLVTANAAKFVALPVSEQLFMLGFRPS